jgi:hypothetical protein
VSDHDILADEIMRLCVEANSSAPKTHEYWRDRAEAIAEREIDNERKRCADVAWRRADQIMVEVKAGRAKQASGEAAASTLRQIYVAISSRKDKP